MRESVRLEIRELVAPPSHVVAIAAACAADLLGGPTWARLPGGDVTKVTSDDFSPIASDLDVEEGDRVVETYGKEVGGVLRDFIGEIPTIYLDEDDFVSTSEPTAEADPDDGGDGDGTATDTWVPAYRELSHREVVEATFGATIAREFR